MKTTALLMVFSLLLYSVSYAGESTDAGYSSADSALEKYGNQSGINDNMFNPLMSDGVNMKTLDGGMEFNARLMCPSSARFMEVLVQPGASGDITALIVSQDTDFNGSLDYTYQVPFAVSGICANGLIGCNPGTWDYCRAYKWVGDPSTRIMLQETLNTNLGGCFCINNSCGNNLVLNNVAYIMKSLGGGVVGALHSSSSRYAVSGIQIDGMLATYFGQNAGGCTSSTVSTTSGSNLEKYYLQPGMMDENAQSEKVAQGVDPKSMHSLVNGITDNNNRELRTCSISRRVSMDWSQLGKCAVSDSVTDHCEAIHSDPSCSLKDEKVDGVDTFRNFGITGLTPSPSCTDVTETMNASCSYGCPDNIYNPCFGDPAVCVGPNGSQTSCELVNPVIWTQGGAGSIKSVYGSMNQLYFGPEAYVEFAPGVEVWGFVNTCVGDGIAYYAYGYAPGMDPNTGKSYDSVIHFYGVPYYSDLGNIYLKGIYLSGADSFFSCGWSGGFTIAPSSFSINNKAYCSGGSNMMNAYFMHCPFREGTCSGGYCSKTCSQNTCRDWWKKERVYACTGSGYDFSDAKKRVKTIKNSTADNVSTMTYTDYRKDNTSNYIYENKAIGLNGLNRPSFSGCEMACKTRKMRDSHTTNVDEKKDDYLKNTTTYDFFYKSCRVGSCPVGAAEEIVKNCQCISEFAEAALIMQVVRSAAQDAICSSGNLNALK